MVSKHSYFVFGFSHCSCRGCRSFVVSSLWNHGAQETCVAQEGVRQEGRQEEGGQAVGQAQREEGRQEAPFPQAFLQEGRRRCLRSWYVCVGDARFDRFVHTRVQWPLHKSVDGNSFGVSVYCRVPSVAPFSAARLDGVCYRIVWPSHVARPSEVREKQGNVQVVMVISRRIATNRGG